jgi:D-3-phosphoglycerate dehydrogenase / 2-oxoglutarate reductase
VIQNAVNVPSVSYEEYQELRPYIHLADKLGAFVAQISDGNIEEITISFTGSIAQKKTELLVNSLIQGVLGGTASREQ